MGRSVKCVGEKKLKGRGRRTARKRDWMMVREFCSVVLGGAKVWDVEVWEDWSILFGRREGFVGRVTFA